MWFRVRVLLENVGRGHITPSVDVRLVSQLPEDPTHGVHRLSLVLERELMLGLQREIVHAIQGRSLVSPLSSRASNRTAI